ncbi:MAG: hypothetical protein ACREOH_05435, partial [Candidatus Entotheonellia bacterium]
TSGTRSCDTCDLHLPPEHRETIKHGHAPLFRKMTILYTGEPDTYDRYCHTHHIHHFGKHR